MAFSDPAPPTTPTVGPAEPVSLVKGRHRWTFACDAGDEAAMLRRVGELARGPDAPFDWFDAALVTHQLQRRLKSDLKRIDHGDAGTSP